MAESGSVFLPRAGESGLGGLFVVFWCDSVPVGQLSIPASLLPITSSQLAATLPRSLRQLSEIGFWTPAFGPRFLCARESKRHRSPGSGASARVRTPARVMLACCSSMELRAICKGRAIGLGRRLHKEPA